VATASSVNSLRTMFHQRGRSDMKARALAEWQAACVCARRVTACW